MSNPWEDFTPATTTDKTSPWDDFKGESTSSTPSVDREDLNNKYKKWGGYAKQGLESAGAGIEALINTGVGLAGMIPGTLAAGTNLANTAVREGRLLSPQELEKSFAGGAEILDPVTKWLAEQGTPLGQEYTEKLGGALMEHGGAFAGLHGSLPKMGAKPILSLENQTAVNAARGAESIPTPVKAPSTISAKLDALDKAKTTEVAPWEDFKQGGEGAFKNISETLGYKEGEVSPVRQPEGVTPTTRMTEQLLGIGEEGRAKTAQEMIDRRQAEMEQRVKTDTGLQQGATERARQENAPVYSAEHLAEQERLKTVSNEQLKQHQAEVDALQARVNEAKGLKDTQEHQLAAQEAQKTLDERQTALTQEVSRRQALDFGAAERARQEVAPIPSVDAATQLKTAVENHPTVKRATTVLAKAQKAEETAVMPMEKIQAKAAVARAETVLSRAKVNITEGLSKSAGPKPESITSFNLRTRGQGGAVKLPDLSKLANKINDTIKDISTMGFNHKNAAQEFTTKLIPQVKEDLAKRITAPDRTEDVVKTILAPTTKDTPPIWKWLQSGPAMTASKFGDNPLLQHIGRVLNYASKRTDLVTKTVIFPLEKYISTLNGKDIDLSWQIMKREEFNNKRYTPAELQSLGMSEKQIQGYNMWREASKDAFDRQNAARTKLGMKPIEAREAHAASVWHGDYHTPILDKTGRLVWYVRTTTKAEGYKAVEHLKKTMGDQLAISDKTKPEYRESGRNPNTPNDIVGAYHDMMDFFKDDPQVTAQIRESLGDYIESKGYTVAGQNKHFLKKGNIRGFEGDRPWLSDRENAYAGMKSQMAYLKSATRWSHMQEAIAQIKDMTTNPDVAAKMPNAIEYANSVMSTEFGASPGVLSALEAGIAKLVPSTMNPTKWLDSKNYGVSRSSLYRGTGDLKTLTYLQTLGLSVGYMIATPLQGAFFGTMNHTHLTDMGFKHNLGKTAMLAMSDATAGIAAHMAHEMGMKDAQFPMTETGRQLLKFAEDNGVVTKNMFDESGGLGQHAALNAVQNALGWTIGFPEKVGRLGAFASFVHHLEQSGKYPSATINGRKVLSMELFRKAEELTDSTMTSFKSFDRPQVVNNLGITGQMAYVYKSAVFNAVNNMSAAGRWAAQGQVKPLLAIYASYAVMGGLQSMPGVNEADGLWNLTKEGIAKFFPQHYAAVKGSGLKASLINIGPETAGIKSMLGYGAPSAMIGAHLTSRLTADIIDPEHPLSGLAPIASKLKEQSSLAGTLLLGGSGRAITQGLYANAPPVIKGQMETNMDYFKSGTSPGNQLYHNPNDLMNVQKTLGHRRTLQDEDVRSLGLTSLNEKSDLQRQWIKQAEDKRIESAKQGLIERTLTAIEDKKPKEVSDNIQAYLQLNPDGNALKQSITKGIIDSHLTPMEKQARQMKAFKQIDSYMRYKGMSQ